MNQQRIAQLERQVAELLKLTKRQQDLIEMHGEFIREILGRLKWLEQKVKALEAANPKRPNR